MVKHLGYRFKGQCLLTLLLQLFDLTTITYNSCKNDALSEPSLLRLHNFVMCGHDVSYQQESSQRAILDCGSYV